jgi:hypothetical protein
MKRRPSALALILAAALVCPSAGAQTPPADPELKRGIQQLDEGDYESAILTLDNAARRLAKEPGQVEALSQAYLYLGIAYLGRGHEAAARAKFRQAVHQLKDMSLSPDKFPPKVIEMFEAAKEQEKGERATTPPAPAPAGQKAAKTGGGGGGGKKVLLIVGGLAAVGGGVAAAAGGGGSSGSGSGSVPNDARQSFTFTGRAAPQQQDGFSIVARGSGVLEARLQWTNNQIRLDIGCQEEAPPYTNCNGTFNRTSNTTGVYTANVSQKTYLIVVSNFGDVGTEAYTLTVLAP